MKQLLTFFMLLLSVPSFATELGMNVQDGSSFKLVKDINIDGVSTGERRLTFKAKNGKECFLDVVAGFDNRVIRASDKEVIISSTYDYVTSTRFNLKNTQSIKIMQCDGKVKTLEDLRNVFKGTFEFSFGERNEVEL